MNSFLRDLAENLLAKNPSMEGISIVFPNQRAVLYFRKHLGELLTKPAFAPDILTIEEFVEKLSNVQVPDRLELIHRLYQVYGQVKHGREGAKVKYEPFDQFYFWGDMLLRDFDEVDKYLVEARQLFRDLSNLKELDTGFDFLTDKQVQYLRTFWGNFSDNLNKNKAQFLSVWRLLPEVYASYREHLLGLNLAYEGLLQRQVAETLGIDGATKWKGHVIFAGFNALTAVEEKILSHFVKHEGAEVHWDMDAYYVNSEVQEAGKFFREYQKHEVLKSTFPGDIPANFSQPKKVRILGSAQHVGQAKLMSKLLNEGLSEEGFDPEDTLVVLPDEKLLLPVLHSVSGSVEKLNVTMGFPLSGTPVFNLIEFLVELQQFQRDDYFNHRQVLSILSHPYIVAADPSGAYQHRKAIVDGNLVSVPTEVLSKFSSLYTTIFQPLGRENILGYLRNVLLETGAIESLTTIDKEYVYHALKLVNRILEIMGVDPMRDGSVERSQKESLKSFIRLFRQLGRSLKIPFSGEPLQGLQVMGVLETRNLDFKNVFVLSLNEGALPSSGGKGSYIPFHIRKAYKLPTTEHQDAMYAYLFYRVLQRAENVFLFYNTEPDILGQGEMSRFLQQIQFESGWKVKPEILHTPIQPRPQTPIVITKDERVLAWLTLLNEGTKRSKGISPSALNSYIDCSLQFYFKYVARLKEPDEVEAYLDARLFGTLLHDVMEKFYRRILDRKKTNLIQETDFDQYKSALGLQIDEVFQEHYEKNTGKKVTYEGQRLVVREVIRSFAERVLEHDKAYAPFTIEGLERSEMLHHVPLSNAPGRAVLSGRIDRLDSKDNRVRILDYKTGKGDVDFKDVASLFDGAIKNRNKAAFQTLIYALLYKSNNTTENPKLVPGLISRKNLYEDTFRPNLIMNRVEVEDATELLREFEPRLKQLLEDIFDPNKPFAQTENEKTCEYCLFRGICYR